MVLNHMMDTDYKILTELPNSNTYLVMSFQEKIDFTKKLDKEIYLILEKVYNKLILVK